MRARRASGAALLALALAACGERSTPPVPPESAVEPVVQPLDPPAADPGPRREGAQFEDAQFEGAQFEDAGPEDLPGPTPGAGDGPARISWFALEAGEGIGARVRMRVVDPRGLAVASARVGLRFSLSSGEEARIERWSATGADGAWTSELLPAVATVELELRAEGHATRILLAGLRSGWGTDLGDLVLEPGSSLEGVVVGPDGPRPDAEVWVQGVPSVRTDAGGHFALAGLPAGQYWPRVRVPGMAECPAPPVRLGRGEAVDDLRLRVQPGRELEVRVLDEAGHPVGGARVAASLVGHQWLEQRGARTLSYARPAWEGRTGVDGSCRLEDLPRGDFAVSALAPGLRLRRSAVPRGRRSVELRLLDLPSRLGELTEAGSGRPVDPTVVSVLTASSPSGPWQMIRGQELGWSRGDGLFQFRVLGTGWHRVLLQADDHVRALSEAFVPSELGERILRCEARDGPRWTGRVLDAEGRPVAAALVLLSESAGEEMSQPIALQTLCTAIDGSFVTPPLADGRYQVTVDAPTYFPAVRSDLQVVGGVAPEAGELRMDRGAGLKVRWEGLSGRRGALELHLLRVVEEEEEGAGEVRGGASPSLVRTITPAQDEIEVWPLVPGRYRVLVKDLEPRLGLAGRLRRDRAPPSLDRDPGAEEASPDPEPIPPRLILVPAQELVDCRVGELRTVTVAPQPASAASLRGRVRLGGDVGAGVDVVWSHGSTRNERVVTTDHRGRYSMEGLLPGPGTLGVYTSASARWPFRQALDLTPGETCVLHLDIPLASLSGRLVDAGGAALSGVSISLSVVGGEGERQPMESLRSDPEGRFEFARLPAGPLLLEAARSGRSRARLERELAAGQALDLGDVVLGEG